MVGGEYSWVKVAVRLCGPFIRQTPPILLFLTTEYGNIGWIKTNLHTQARTKPLETTHLPQLLSYLPRTSSSSSQERCVFNLNQHCICATSTHTKTELYSVKFLITLNLLSKLLTYLALPTYIPRPSHDDP
jgi:hypothetical protein